MISQRRRQSQQRLKRRPRVSLWHGLGVRRRLLSRRKISRRLTQREFRVAHLRSDPHSTCRALWRKC